MHINNKSGCLKVENKNCTPYSLHFVYGNKETMNRLIKKLKYLYLFTHV